MRGSLSTIQQTLTPEAAIVLNNSISEASRRSHGHTTPLHVAAVLLSSPSGLLRQACLRSHPNSSHPLQCRALDLCFTVALDRLPSSSPAPSDPPLSNALLAALKRAQAHQRRGFPDQHQPPLLALKVDLDQLIISILDDPSVSRVMREASFSSPAVKSAFELPSPTAPKLGPLPARHLYLNPRFQPPQSAIPNSGPDDVTKVIEILSRSRKKNPILVGESEPDLVLREVLKRIERTELGNVEVASVMNELSCPVRLRELGGLIQSRMNASGRLILDLGDLKWLVDNQQHPSIGLGHQSVSEAAREAVAEMGKVIARYRDGQGNGGSRLWVIGTATCETYLRCQVYHPSMEMEWDLQAVSIASKATRFPRFTTNGIHGSSLELYTSPSKSLYMMMQPMTGIDRSRKLSCCPHCLESYEHEVSKLTGEQSKPTLPQWLQDAKIRKNGDKGEFELSQRKDQELMRKWSDRCLLLHPGFHRNGSLDGIIPKPLPLASLYAIPNLLGCQPKKSLGDDLRLTTGSQTPPSSPVRTDLVLGNSTTRPSKVGELQSDEPLDAADSFKKLLKVLIEKVWWQRDAASAVTTAITRCRLGNGRRCAGGAKGDVWMMFSGPDRAGKKKLVAALSEQMYGTDPVVLSLGSRRDRDDSEVNFRGKTVLDRIAEAIRRNPFSVLMLQDVDEADVLVRGSIKRAMERGRFTDSHGRELSLGSIIFFLTTNNQPPSSQSDHELDEEKLALVASGGWQLRLSMGNRRATKRNRSLSIEDEERPSKQRKEMSPSLSFDLNETTDFEEDRVDSSHNSSDLTVEYEEDKTTSEFLDLVDEAIVLKPVDFGLLRKNLESTIKARFRAILGDEMSLSVQNEALDKILGGAWLGKTGLDSWVEQVLAPAIHQVKTRMAPLPSDECLDVRLELDDMSEDRGDGDWLPSRVGVSVSDIGG